MNGKRRKSARGKSPSAAPLPALLALLALNGCGKPSAPGQGGPAGSGVSAVVARVQTQALPDRVPLVASLAAKDQVTVVSELDATVKDIAFTEGRRVEEGAVLFRLDPVRPRAQLEEAEAAFRLAQLSFQRSKELLENNTISQQEYDQAEAAYHEREADLALARDQYANTTIAAPFAGVVGERMVSRGQFVSRGQALTTLIRMDPLHLVFDVPERYAGRLRAGQSTLFRSEAFPGELFEGRVVYIAPAIDERARTLRVKAEVANPDGRLKPGMFGELDLLLGEQKDALLIPEACVRYHGGAADVMAVNAQGRAEPRTVRVGRHVNGQVEILDGLQAGEWVVVEGFQKMGPGTPVVAAPESGRYGVTPGPLAAAGEPPPGPAPEKSEDADAAH